MGKRVDRSNRYHAFLRRLRAGGRSNMYGAVPYLAQAFGLDRETAFHIICEWVDLQAALDADTGTSRAPVTPAVPPTASVAPAPMKPAPPKPAPPKPAGLKPAGLKPAKAKSVSKPAPAESSLGGTGGRRRKREEKGDGKRGPKGGKHRAVPRKPGRRAA